MNWLSRQIDRFRGVRDALPASVAQASPVVQFGGGGWINAATGMGTARDPATATTYGYQIPLPDDLRDNLYEYEATTGIVVDRPAKDLVRRGYDLKGFEGHDLIGLQSALDDLKMQQRLSRLYKWMRKDGGAAMVAIVDDGRPHHMPIDWQRLRRVHALQVVERRQISIAAWNCDPTSEGYNEPLMYYVHTTGPRSPTNLIHRDRVFRLVNGDLPHRSQQRHRGWGVSVIDRIWGPLRAKGAALAALSTILSSFMVDVVKIKGFADAVKLGNKQVLQDRADLMRATLGNLSKIFLDADAEDFAPVIRSVAGVADIVEILIDEAQAATSIPKSILRGLTPGGLGDGENAGETRAYYDFMAGEQSDYYVPPATWVVNLVARSGWGPLLGRPPESWCFEPRPLWTPTEQERAQIRLTHAQARSADWLSGNLGPDEWRSDVAREGFYDLASEGDREADELGEFDRPFPPGHTPMTTREAAEHFGVSPTTIRSMITSGKVSAYQLNGRYVVSLQEIMQAAQRVKTAPKPEPQAELPGAST